MKLQIFQCNIQTSLFLITNYETIDISNTIFLPLIINHKKKKKLYPLEKQKSLLKREIIRRREKAKQKRMSLVCSRKS